jgi:hypothetical protein
VYTSCHLRVRAGRRGREERGRVVWRSRSRLILRGLCLITEENKKGGGSNEEG